MPEKAREFNLYEPQHQSLMGVVVYIMRNFRAMITLFISIIAIAAGKPGVWLVLGFAALPVAIIFTVLAYYQYRNFTFHVNGDELIIHKGVFFKDRMVVSADRIQSIQITENLLQRILGLVALKVDTAGSKGSELEIPALERKRADALKELLYRKKEEQNPEAEPISVEEEGSEATAAPQRVLVHLGVIDLLKVGLTENHLRTGLVALAFVVGTFSQYQEFISSYFDESVDTIAEQAVNAGLTVLVSFFVFYAVLSVIMSMVRTVARFYDLKAVLKADAVEISTGLFKRNHFRVPLRKVQYVQWERNPLRSAVGFESAKLKPSNSLGQEINAQKIEIPALKPLQSAQLADGIFGNYVDPKEGIEGNAAAYARFAMIVSSFFVLPPLILLFWQFGYFALGMALLIPFIGFLGYQYGKTVKLLYNPQFVLIKRGWIFKERVALPSFKLQSISISQNIFIKRRGLCHVKMYTAAGALSVRYLPEEEARTLYNVLLYCVEKSTESWM